MKFLGLRLCDHDTNITLTVDDKVYYYKLERDLQLKHVGFRNLTGWYKKFLQWGVPLSEIDAIGITLDCHKYKNIRTNEQELFEEIKIPLFTQMGYKGPIYRVDHHYAHALSAWMLGESDVDMVYDGFGDDHLSQSIFRNDHRTYCASYKTHPSFGTAMGDTGALLRLRGISYDMAGKIMALKGYGNVPEEEIDDIHNRLGPLTMKDHRKLWNFPMMERICENERVMRNHIQICHTISERIIEEYFANNTKETDRISYTGGVALNTIINSRIRKKRPNLIIPAHAGDEGLSLGIVESLRKEYKQPEFKKEGYPFWQTDEAPKERPSKLTIKSTAELLAQGNIVAWYQGHGEVGPRALGNRSILMNPTIKGGKDKLNLKVKHREPFRPFGASVLREKCSEYFDCEYDSPYMLYVMDVKDKEAFAPITHVDGTCRPQTVTADQEDFYELLTEFEKLTGLPMLLNTSLNNGGDPIAGSISEALQLLYDTELDFLVTGNETYTK